MHYPKENKRKKIITELQQNISSNDLFEILEYIHRVKKYPHPHMRTYIVCDIKISVNKLYSKICIFIYLITIINIH